MYFVLYNFNDTYFMLDSMNWSYSTAILQDKAWRLWAAEQFVLMTLSVGDTKKHDQYTKA